MHSWLAPIQLIVEDSPQSGAWNMAVDEALLEESLRTGDVFVRLYRWSEATVSLGYFQKATDCDKGECLATLPVVRRLSGGGAILHHHEQTYSCCLPPRHPFASQPLQLYDLIHSAVIEFLHERGVTAAPRGKDARATPEPFLCFRRHAAPDLVVQGRKVLGSAQRRRRGAVLQHGSLLLRASEFASDLPGLLDLAPEIRWDNSTAEGLGERMASVLGASAQRAKLPEELRTQALTFGNVGCQTPAHVAVLEEWYPLGIQPN